jgi:hypothetical protein
MIPERRVPPTHVGPGTGHLLTFRADQRTASSTGSGRSGTACDLCPTNPTQQVLDEKHEEDKHTVKPDEVNSSFPHRGSQTTEPVTSTLDADTAWRGVRPCQLI